MILKTLDLRKFKAASSHIKSNGIIPVLDYLSFGNGTVTKNNLHSFIVYDLPGATPMLVEERKLLNALTEAKGDTIEITYKSGKVVIDNGRQPTKSDTITDEFPVNALPDGAAFPLTEPLLNAISTAAGFTDDNESDIFTAFVFVGNKFVSASNNFIGYFKEFSDDLPEIILRKEVAQAVSHMDNVAYSENENYQFFTQPGIVHGFAKFEMKYRNLTAILANKGDDAFTTTRDGIISFCNQVIADSPLKTLTASFKVDGALQLKMNDNAYGYEAETHPIPCEGSADEFPFNPGFMVRLLKLMPDEPLAFSPAKFSYFITAESGDIALMMQMEK